MYVGIPTEIALTFFYSHRKNLIAAPVHTAVTPNITRTGTSGLLSVIPRNVLFIRMIPCVSGNMLITFCSRSGMNSIGTVVPENTSMGK